MRSDGVKDEAIGDSLDPLLESWEAAVKVVVDTKGSCGLATD